MTYYKFVTWDAIPIEEALKGALPQALQEYDNGNKKPLKELHLVLDNPHVDRGGWRFNVRPYLKCYWVKLRGYGINEYYAINKTDIRKQFGNYVIKIVEIKGDQEQ